MYEWHSHVQRILHNTLQQCASVPEACALITTDICVRFIYSQERTAAENRESGNSTTAESGDSATFA